MDKSGHKKKRNFTACKIEMLVTEVEARRGIVHGLVDIVQAEQMTEQSGSKTKQLNENCRKLYFCSCVSGRILVGF